MEALLLLSLNPPVTPPSVSPPPSPTSPASAERVRRRSLQPSSHFSVRALHCFRCLLIGKGEQTLPPGFEIGVFTSAVAHRGHPLTTRFSWASSYLKLGSSTQLFSSIFRCPFPPQSLLPLVVMPLADTVACRFILLPSTAAGAPSGLGRSGPIGSAHPEQISVRSGQIQ
ncbi:hypothetical protein CRG98_016113 [Punica granatum]|uniref:Uncharacterized protein n=1 Tax=Punica granatum TaxID=22663 RepID=A0A2I0K6W4_PUNGR|nr:hypothetical protein CRG98_016113 [Punica granatum]